MNNDDIKEVFDKCLFCDKVFNKNSITHPFCSNRCKKADFNQWLGEEYSVVDAETIVSIPSNDDEE